MLGAELGGVGSIALEHVAGEFDDHDLHAQAEPQVGHPLLAGVAGGPNLPLDGPFAEAARHHNAVHPLQGGLTAALLQLARVHPADVHPQAVVNSGVDQGLLHRKVGIGQLGVLAHHRHRNPTARALEPRPPTSANRPGRGRRRGDAGAP